MDANKIDVDALFKQYTIKEVQAIELQVKNEIEKKKEDLRIMVYNRYRDIIDAADGIHIMKNCSKKIETVLSELQGTCDTVFNSKADPTSTDQARQQKSLEKTTRNHKYVLAVIIKILQNSPSKIWYHLDNAEFTKAAKQYLLAQHAHICLELEPSLKGLANSVSHIQYANELWSSIVFLSRTITAKARSVFTDLSVNSAKTLTNAMAAIYLLESSNLENIFSEFLEKRTPMIKSVIHINTKEQSNTVSIKERILKCLKSFVDTVNQIYSLFADDIENKTLSFEDSINDATFTIESLKDDGFLVAKIPNYLKNVKFKDTTGIKRFEREYLIDRANSWLAGCLADLHQGIEYTFKYVKSLKNLVEIRDFVIDFEAEIKQDRGQTQASWMHICQVLFNKEILIWSELISPFYYVQTKLVIESALKRTQETLITSLKESLSDKLFVCSDNKTLLPETDINSYIWSLENSQLTSNMNSQKGTKQKSFDLLLNRSFSSSQLKNPNNGNQHNVTPAIKELCKQLDDQLEYLLEDIEHTTKFSVKNRIPNMKSIITEDFDRCNEYLEKSLKEFSHNFCQSLTGLIEALSAQSGEKERIKKILLICRFTNALVNFSSPNLKATFNHVNQQVVKQRKIQLDAKLSDTNDLMQMLSAAKKKSVFAEQKIVDQTWSRFTDELQGICKFGFKVWIESLCEEIKTNYLSDLGDAIDSIPNKQQLLATNDLVAWDEIEIEDELGTEEDAEEPDQDKSKPQVGVDEALKSKLHAPLVCSPIIQTILYTLCQELCKNLSYNMIDTGLIIRDLVMNVFELILKYYRSLVANRGQEDRDMYIKLTQNQSLQMLFDLRFLYNLFDIKSFVLSAERSRMSRIQSDYKQLNADLETLIDPFDYDICSPFIQSNITKSIGRTAALYGILNTNERYSRSTTGSTALTTANDKFNLVVLSNNQHRFELLPLPSQQSQQQLNLEKQQNQLLKNQAASLKYEASKQKMSSTRAQLADSASTGLSNVLKWFQ